MIPSRYRAEQKFKTILNKLSDDRDEHVRILNDKGESQCNLCSKKFKTKELAFNHLESVHNVHRDADDFGSSSSEEFNGKGDATSETDTDDESSGVDENEQNSNECSDDDDNSNIVSFADYSGRRAQTDSAEIKFARVVVQDHVEFLRSVKLTSKFAELNREL